MPRQVVIENPILNSPYAEPTRHFRFDKEGITNEIVESRRISGYFVPVPPPKKRIRQTALLGTALTTDRFEPCSVIIAILGRVSSWWQKCNLSTSAIPGWRSVYRLTQREGLHDA